MKYYKTTFSSLSYGDLWRCAPWKTALFALGMKLMGSQSSTSAGVPEPVPLSEERIDPQQIDPDILQALRRMVEDLEALGFRDPIFYRHPYMLLSSTTGFAAILRHENGEVFANAICIRSSLGFVKTVGFVTGYTDKTFFSAGTSRKKLAVNPANGSLSLPGQPLLNVFQQHTQARAKWGVNKVIRPIRDERDLEEVLCDYEWSSLRWHINRGAYIQMTAEEVESTRALYQTSTANEPNTLKHLDLELTHILDQEWNNEIVGAAMASLGCASASQWSLSISSSKGNVNIELRMNSPLLKMIKGVTYKGTVSLGFQTSAPVFIDKLKVLLGEFDDDSVEPSPTCAINLNLLEREDMVAFNMPDEVQTKSAGLHVFRMEIEGVNGSFELSLNPVKQIARLVPGADLDRVKAARTLAGLVLR